MKLSSPRSRGEREFLRRAVDDVTKLCRVPVAFGGFVSGSLTVETIAGGLGSTLDGLRVLPGRGLGGRAIAEQRPRMASDYGASRSITHDYDAQVLAEGIRTLLAVPVVVENTTRCILYGGIRADSTVGDVTMAPAVGIAAGLANELWLRDEVERRVDWQLRSLATVADDPGRSVGAVSLADLRDSHAELRAIVASIDDTALRARLGALERRMHRLGTAAVTDTPGITLSPREVDVLSQVSLGLTNAEIATALGLREATVKSYLKTAMTKLDSSTRSRAVVAARRAGALP